MLPAPSAEELVQFQCQYCFTPIKFGQIPSAHVETLPVPQPSGGGRFPKIGGRKSPVSVPLAPAATADPNSVKTPEQSFKDLQRAMRQFDSEAVNLKVSSIEPLSLIEHGSGNEELAEGSSDRIDSETDFRERSDHVGPIEDDLLPYSKKNADAFFDLLSESSSLDFPICCVCADTLIRKMDEATQSLVQQAQEYANQKAEEEARIKEDDEDLDKEIAELEAEEKALLEKLAQLSVEKTQLEGKEIQLQKEEERLIQEENAQYLLINQLDYDIHRSEMALKSVTDQVNQAEQHFNTLQKTNVYNLVFNIWHQDKYGTINGFRLGRLDDASGPRVEWAEINTALGHVCLLVYCLVNKLKLTLRGYRLVPCGSRSYIEQMNPNGQPSVLRLYTDGGVKFFTDSSIDSALVALLNCIEQFRVELERRNSEFRLPYPMKKEGYIYEKASSEIGYSIAMGPGSGSSYHTWTKACRLMLTNLKWGIVGVSTLFPGPGDSS